jgi:hypothetical protein
MRRKTLISSIIFSLFWISGISNPPDEWEFWTRHSATALINEKIEFRISQQFNMNRLMEDMYFHYSEAAISYEFKQWFFTTMVFRQTFKHNGENWIKEPRPYINTTAEIESSNWTFTFRNRAVFRYFRENRNYLRLREKLGLSYDFDFENFLLTPFASGDLWYATDRKQIERYQQYAGIWITPVETLDVGLHYIGNLVNQETEWKLVNAYRVSLSIGL